MTFTKPSRTLFGDVRLIIALMILVLGFFLSVPRTVRAASELYSTSFFSDSNLLNYYRFEGNSNDSKGSNNGTDTNISYSSSYGKFGQGSLFQTASSSKI
ncbi:MAG: hypothetical protein AAB759_01355, partial [Patescibacteria group bacterium]